MRFVTGNKHTRADIKELAGVGRDAKGGPWDAMIHRRRPPFSIEEVRRHLKEQEGVSYQRAEASSGIHHGRTRPDGG